jgi:hypothetical protein
MESIIEKGNKYLALKGGFMGRFLILWILGVPLGLLIVLKILGII